MTMISVRYTSPIKLTKDITYIALTGKLKSTIFHACILETKDHVMIRSSCIKYYLAQS